MDNKGKFFIWLKKQDGSFMWEGMPHDDRGETLATTSKMLQSGEYIEAKIFELIAAAKIGVVFE